MESYESNDYLFSASSVTEEEKDYDAMHDTMMNTIKDMDEIKHVKEKLMFVKENNPEALKAAVLELPNKRRDYLNTLMSVAKVQQENRKIFKIKR